jgi:DNA-3-methyladenine glycosylase
MTLRKLTRSFYLRPTLVVARDLLGKLLVRQSGVHRMVGRIVEVEAYKARSDPASHSFRGRTPRNEVMFWQGGYLYVYFTYGMHYCANVVTEGEHTGCAVLLRALEPLEGIKQMARSRDLPESAIGKLCNGPAKLCEAFGIGREENGSDLCANVIWIGEEKNGGKHSRIARSPRIGISAGKGHLWRLTIPDSPYLSR